MSKYFESLKNYIIEKYESGELSLYISILSLFISLIALYIKLTKI